MSTSSTIKTRDPYWDILKGLAIILVVAGHSIQLYSGLDYRTAGLFWDNPSYKFIYSFHMPLFMTICGFFFWISSHKRTLTQLLVNKIQTILIPIFTFSLFSFLVYRHDEWCNLSVFEIAKHYYHCFRGCLWFLWTLLRLSIIVAVIQKTFNDKWYIYLVIFALTFVIPDGVFGWMGASDKFMYPFFVFGYFMSKYHWLDKIISYERYALPLSAIILFCGLFTWVKESYIYTSGVTILHKATPLLQLGYDVQRIITGMGGVILWLIIIRHFTDTKSLNVIKRAIAFVGIYSLGIYGIHQNVLPITIFTNTFSGPNIILTSIETIAIVSISTLISWMLSKSKVTNFLFLGGR